MDAGSKHKSDLVIDLQKKIKFFFEGRSYGSDLENYIIGFTSVLTLPVLSIFLKPRNLCTFVIKPQKTDLQERCREW